MPLYEYRCESCNKTFEVRQKFSDEPLTTHPECGGSAKRLLSAPGLQFKGTGWYITDYARSGNAGTKSSSSSSSDSSSSSSSSSESKPAAPASTPSKSE